MDLKLIKPKNLKVSDKYSANLYKFLKKNPNARVFYRKINRWNNEPLVYDSSRFSIGNAYIGQDLGCTYSATCLMDILRTGTLQQWCFSKGLHGEFVDITEQFFQDYRLIGRCLFDASHSKWLLGDDNRFTYVNEDNRICNWCGQIHVKRIETETIVKEHIIWE